MKYKLGEKQGNLFKIIALKDFLNIKIGDTGGWIESEANLSQSGNAWVYGNAQVSDNAQVYGNARVYGDAQVYGNTLVSDNARVYGNAWVYGNAQVYGNARVYGNAWVYGNAQVYGNARVYGDARVSGDAQVSGSLKVTYTPLNIYGLKYNITIFKNHIQAGCHLRTTKNWKALDSFEGYDTFFRNWKNKIINIAEQFEMDLEGGNV